MINCLQLGHMRTNKKCPLYNEEGEHVAWQDSVAAADGLLERQGTKITIKRKSIPTKKMEELDSPKSVQPPEIITPLPKKEISLPVPLLKTPSLRMKIKLSGANQNSDSSLAPSVSNPPRENIEKLHGVHANDAGDTGICQTPRPLLKLKLSNQKRKDRGSKRLKQDQDVEAARKERERIRVREREEREAYEEALIEEREREEMEREERERERKERDDTELKRKATPLRTNGAEISRGNKGENKLVFVNKMIKKKIVRAQDDPELLRRREREREQRQEVAEYQRALDEELKREQEELDRKEERERGDQGERFREEQVQVERARHRHHLKEKERRRELHRLREEAIVREAELEAERAAMEKEEIERKSREEEQQQREREVILLKNMKSKHIKEPTRVVSGPPSGLSGERDRGKGIKRRPDVPPLSYHHTPDFGNAPKRLRKKRGEVNFPLIDISVG